MQTSINPFKEIMTTLEECVKYGFVAPLMYSLRFQKVPVKPT